MKLGKVDATFFGLVEGVDYSPRDCLVAWFAKYYAAPVATKDETAADVALAKVDVDGALDAKGVPRDQARAWALTFMGKASATPADPVAGTEPL